MLLTMYIVRNYILHQKCSFPKPGLGTLAVGTVFIQGLSATMGIEQYQYKGGKAWEVRGWLALEARDSLLASSRVLWVLLAVLAFLVLLVPRCVSCLSSQDPPFPHNPC